MMMMVVVVCNVIRMSMEMDLMSPFLLRQTAAVSNVHVTVTSLNRVQLDRSAMSKV